MAASKMNRRIVFQGYDTVSSSTYIEQQKNPNTKRKTESDIQHFLLFLGANGEERRPEDISAAELDERLGMFFLGIRKDNGEDYEPDSLTSKHRSIARSTAMGIQTGMGRIAAILGNVVFGLLVDTHCAIPLLMVASLLVIGGLAAIKLPNTKGTELH